MISLQPLKPQLGHTILLSNHPNPIRVISVGLLYSIYEASELTWQGIQCLASIWNMENVEALALRQLEELDQLDAIFAEQLALWDH